MGGASVSNTPNSSQRFVPRPSPERLAAQVKSVEATQELMMDMMAVVLTVSDNIVLEVL